MKDWEFLIQQAGDRHWQSLEPCLGLLTTGNYRMVARTPYINCLLAITLTYRDAAEPSPTIALNESRQTNAEGLVMIFPDCDLRAGNWQLSCTSQDLEVTTESTTNTWEKAIAFQVSDQIFEVAKIPEQAPELDGKKAIASLESSALGGENLDDDLDEAVPFATPLDENITPIFPLVLTLERNEFSEIGEAFLLLAGQVEADDRDRPLSFPARLRYRLQDLDSAVYILDEPKSWLPNLGEVTPFTFQETLALPPTEGMDLLGEVLIETETGEILAQVLFNLTLSPRREDEVAGESVNYTIQLSNLENQSSFTFEVIVPKEAAETPLNVDLPNPALMNRLLRRSQLLDRQILPPKIEPILGKSPPKKSLQLPKISPLSTQ